MDPEDQLGPWALLENKALEDQEEIKERRGALVLEGEMVNLGPPGTLVLLDPLDLTDLLDSEGPLTLWTPDPGDPRPWKPLTLLTPDPVNL
uniref:Uncharacterized protein n=1 Tax=Knipowitschia caucasica TaxID=637954 RepID=A0AAV2M3B4_KNICA